VAVFLNGDLKSAQHLIAQKIAFRELEMRYATATCSGLSGNTPQSIETSSLHLDLIADFQAHEFAVLLGGLSDSRIRRRPGEDTRG